MPKNKLLLVDLNDKKTKKLAEDDTEQNMAKELGIPISTIHYHLQKLVEASLVVVDEFHYSKKGREVNHYKLANKYIIIAPKKVSGIKRALNNILPVGLVVLGVSGVIKLISSLTSKVGPVQEKVLMAAKPTMAKSTMDGAAESVRAVSSTPDMALWFLIGGMSTIVIYLLVMLIKEKLKK